MTRPRRTRRPPLRSPPDRPGARHRHPGPRLSWLIPTAAGRLRADALRDRGPPRRRAPRRHVVDSGEQILVPWPGAPLRRASRYRTRPGPRRRELERLERAGRRGGRSAEPRRLDRPLHQPARHRQPGPPAPILSRRDRPARTIAKARLLRHRARPLPRPPQRPARRRPASWRPGWTAYQHRLRYQTYDVTDLRRPRARTAWTSCSATAGTAAGSASRAGAPSTATGSPCWPSSRSTTADGTVARARTDGSLDRPGERVSPTTSTTASAPTCAAAAADATPVDVLDADLEPAGRARRPAGPDHRGPARDRRHHSPSGQDARRLRAEPGRLGPAAGPRRRGRRGGRAPARRGARGRRTRRPPAAHGQGHRHLPARRRGRGDAGAGADLPRLPVRRGHRRRRPARRGHRGGRRRLRPAPHGLVRVLARAAQPLPRERGLGHARQLRRRAHRLPAARRAARLDRRHPGLLPHRELPVRQRRLPHQLARRPGRRAAEGRLGPVRDPGRAPRDAGPATAAWGDAATIVPWVLYQRTGDRDLLARQLPSMRAWVDRMAGLAGDGPAVGRRVPVRRLARPDRAAGGPVPGQDRPGRHRHRTPGPVRRDRGARRRGWPATPTVARALRATWPPGCGPRSPASTSPPAAGCSATRPRRTPWPCSGLCCPTAEQRRARRAAARRPGPRRRFPDQHRLRRHAADDRRAGRRRASRSWRTGCCCRPAARPGCTR